MKKTRIVVRYYQVGVPDEPHVRKLPQSLHEISAMEMETRAKTVGGINCRLERLQERNGLLCGEIIKIQEDNLPAEVHARGLAKLGASKIGFGVAFVFDPTVNTLAIQYLPNVMSTARLREYLRAHHVGNAFSFILIPAPDVWEKISRSDIKSFHIRMAMPKHFSQTAGGELCNSLKDLAQVYGAPYVTVKLSVGRQKTPLSEGLIEQARAIFSQDDNLRAMKIKTFKDPEEIDLLHTFLKDEAELELPDEPEQNYRERSNYVQLAYNERRAYIKESLG